MCAKKRSIGCSRCDDIIKEHLFLTTYIHTYIHTYIKILTEIRYGFPGLKMMDLEEARLSDPSADTKRYEHLGIFLIHTYIHVIVQFPGTAWPLVGCMYCTSTERGFVPPCSAARISPGAGPARREEWVCTICMYV